MLLKRCPSAPAVCALLLAGAVLHGLSTRGVAAQEGTAELLSELSDAQQEQDHARLRALYAQLAQLQPGNPEFQRGLGLSSYLQGDFEGAIEALERVASLESDLPGARLYLGISYYRTNRFAEALAELEQSPELVGNEPMARYWQGATLRALGRLAEAISALEAARAGAGTNPDVLEMLTRSYSQQSAEYFRRLLNVAATSPPARLLRAEELAMDGAEDAALNELDVALDEAPGLVGLHGMKGQVLWSREEYEKGADEFRRELENDPISVESHVRLGAYFLDSGDSASALGHLRLAERFGPQDERVGELLDQALRAGGAENSPLGTADGSPTASRVSLQAARDHYRRGEAGEAALLLKQLLDGRPESIEARKLLARCQLVEGRIEQAAEQLQQILARVQDDPETLYLLGKSYEKLASNTAERLFELNPRSSRIRMLRGEAFERGPLYEFEKALAEFRAAKELGSADSGVHHAIGRVLFKMKRFDEAVPHLEAALALNRGHGIANYLLGRIKLLNGDRVGAIQSLSAAVEARPGMADAQRDLARALVLEGRHDEGIQIYRSLLETNPADTSLHALLAATYRRAGRLEEAKAQAEKARLAGAE